MPDCRWWSRHRQFLASIARCDLGLCDRKSFSNHQKLGRRPPNWNDLWWLPGELGRQNRKEFERRTHASFCQQRSLFFLSWDRRDTKPETTKNHNRKPVCEVVGDLGSKQCVDCPNLSKWHECHNKQSKDGNHTYKNEVSCFHSSRPFRSMSSWIFLAI